MFDNPRRGPVKAITAHEARERHMHFVQFDALGLRLNKPSELYVYHYTNLAGLRGIVESRALWASDYRYLNDRTEFAFGLDILEMCVAHEESVPVLPESLRQEVLFEIAMMKRGHSSTYVLSVSFCEKGNVLSQWRAYGRQDGVAIGFDRAYLMERAAAQGFACGPVHYYWSEAPGRDQAERFPAWLDRRCGELASELGEPPQVQIAHEAAQEPDDLDAEVARLSERRRRLALLRRWIAETAAFIKHPAFAEEIEWRCVRVIDSSDHGTPAPVKDRAAGTKLVPYVDLGLSNDADQFTGMKHIVIGPSNDPSAVSHAASHITDKLALREGFGVFFPFHPLKA